MSERCLLGHHADCAGCACDCHAQQVALADLRAKVLQLRDRHHPAAELLAAIADAWQVRFHVANTGETAGWTPVVLAARELAEVATS